MVQSTVDKHGRIDILINNAGITVDGFLTKMEESDWEKVISVNLSGVFKCTKAVAPIMLKQGSGVILKCIFCCRLIRKYWSNQLCCNKSWSHWTNQKLGKRIWTKGNKGQCSGTWFH